MKPGRLTIFIMIYFVGMLAYMLAYPTSSMVGYTNFKPWLGVMFSLLTYGLFFAFAQGFVKHTYYSLDIFSLLFFRIYIIFKFIFFSLLINSDMPTYLKWLDSKTVSLVLSLFILVFTLALNFITHDRFQKRLD